MDLVVGVQLRRPAPRASTGSYGRGAPACTGIDPHTQTPLRTRLVDEELRARAVGGFGDALGRHREPASRTSRCSTTRRAPPCAAVRDHRREPREVRVGSSHTMSCWIPATIMTSAHGRLTARASRRFAEPRRRLRRAPPAACSTPSARAAPRRPCRRRTRRSARRRRRTAREARGRTRGRRSFAEAAGCRS